MLKKNQGGLSDIIPQNQTSIVEFQIRNLPVCCLATYPLPYNSPHPKKEKCFKRSGLILTCKLFLCSQGKRQRHLRTVHCPRCSERARLSAGLKYIPFPPFFCDVLQELSLGLAQLMRDLKQELGGAGGNRFSTLPAHITVTQ